MAGKKPTTGRFGTERPTPPAGPSFELREESRGTDRTAPGDELALERGETLPHHDAPSADGPATPYATDDDAEQLKRPRVGDAIGEKGRFIVTETLGMGGMGIVCRARDQQLDRSVAIKFVQWNREIPWGQLTALLRQEAKATAQLNHENIVAIFDIGTWGNVPFLVMEHLEGEPLSQLMRREQLTTERVLEIMVDVLAGLGHAHQANVIHRDLKPSNVFIVKGGRAKILDFGLARIEHAAQLMADGAQPDDVLPRLTSAGTPPYMAPEQWRKHVQDARTDIWAAGVLLYEMLTGELPHGNTMDTWALRAWSLSRQSAPSILLRRPELPESVDRIVARALRKDRRQRFQSADEFLVALREALDVLRGGSSPRRGERAAERRQATLLSAVPVVTAPSRDDPDDELDAHGLFQSVVTETVNAQGGHIFSAGDHVLAGFGYPVATEHDALRAVRAGLHIVDTLREQGVGVRIGITTGVVVIEELSGSQGTAVRGGAPRVAAALAAQADVGTVLIGETTHKLVKGLVQAEERPPSKPDGVDGRIYRALAEESPGSRFEPGFAATRTPLIGRVSKLRMLFRLWDEAKKGHGKAIHIAGEAGIGKSRLVEELRAHVESSGNTRLTCQAWPHFRDSAFRPVIELLLRSMNIQREDSPAVKLEKLEQTLAPLGFKLTEHVPVFAPLLSIPLAEPYKPLELPPAAKKMKTLTALVQMLLAMSREKPVLFVVEDLHWVDHSTVEMLQLLLDEVPSARLLVLLTSRPEFRAPWPDRDHIHYVTLNRLSPSQTGSMIRSVLGNHVLPPELTEQLIARADGVPLFVEEMTSMITETMDADGKAPVAAAIPSTLSEILLARLDRLPATGIELARIGAVIGRNFSYGMIRSVAGLPRGTLDHGISLLIDAGLLVSRGRPPDSKYQFKHALIQDSAYQSLVKKRRQELHSRVAEVLETEFPEVGEIEPELLAHHHTEAGRMDVAVDLWKKAGQRAVERSANVEAVGHFQHALAVLRTLPEGLSTARRELDLLLAMGSPLMAIRGYASPEVEKNYARAFELCQQGGVTGADMFQSIHGLWQFYMVAGNLPKALVLGDQLLSLARGADNRTFQLLAHRALGTTTMLHGDLPAAREHHTTGFEFYDFDAHKGLALRYGHDPGVAHKLYLAWTLWLLGYPDQALARAQEALVLARRLEHPMTIAFASCDVAMIHCYRGEYAVAKEIADTAVQLCQEHKLTLWLAWGNMMAGWARSGLGDYHSGVGQFREGLTGWKGSGARAGMTFFPATAAECCRRAGWLDQAAELVAEAGEIVIKNDEHYYEPELLRLQGELAAAAGDPATAEERFRAGMALAAQQQSKPFELRNAMSLAGLLAARGMTDDGRRRVAEIYEWFTEGTDTADLVAARKLIRGR